VHYLSQLRNALPMLLLRSPLHGLLSGNVKLLTFTGRVSGRSYTIPVVHSRDGETCILTTDSPWWKNLRDGGQVGIRVGRRRFFGHATAETAPEAVASALRTLCHEHPSYHRFAEVHQGADGALDYADAASRRVLIRVLAQEAGT
jgi:hypothetical protein